jgi:RNA polymerase sigma factor (sigma-70 family)
MRQVRGSEPETRQENALPPGESNSTRSDFLRRHLVQPEERARLVRFCRHLTGDPDVAEDLAQDALLEAWRQADALHNPRVWRSWLHGIAKNMYLRWQRGYMREMSRRAPTPDGPGAPSLLDLRPDDAPDVQTILERQELAHLLSRAMTALPAQTRQMLVQHYIDEMPQAEIAARLGLTENTAAVRLHRGKQTLRRVLTTDLREEAATFGLVSSANGGWQETRLWCPMCGKHRLQAGPGRMTDPNFRITCRGCMFVMGPRRIDYPSDCIFGHQGLDAPRLLENIQGFKPAMNRMTGFYQDYLKRGMERGQQRCLGCGAPLTFSTVRLPHLAPRPFSGLNTHCPRCEKMHVVLPTAIAFVTPEVQQFWRRHPRMRTRGIKPVAGTGAFLLSIESVTDCARLDVVFNAETYRVVETNQRPA